MKKKLYFRGLKVGIAHICSLDRVDVKTRVINFWKLIFEIRSEYEMTKKFMLPSRFPDMFYTYF